LRCAVEGYGLASIRSVEFDVTAPDQHEVTGLVLGVAPFGDGGRRVYEDGVRPDGVAFADEEFEGGVGCEVDVAVGVYMRVLLPVQILVGAVLVVLLPVLLLPVATRGLFITRSCSFRRRALWDEFR
jgi:hypothetical protein